jgi:hypothetical protein
MFFVSFFLEWVGGRIGVWLDGLVSLVRDSPSAMHKKSQQPNDAIYVPSLSQGETLLLRVLTLSNLDLEQKS